MCVRFEQALLDRRAPYAESTLESTAPIHAMIRRLYESEDATNSPCRVPAPHTVELQSVSRNAVRWRWADNDAGRAAALAFWSQQPMPTARRLSLDSDFNPEPGSLRSSLLGNETASQAERER